MLRFRERGNAVTEPTQRFWKNLRSKANRTLGDQFWQDMTELLPTQQPRIDVYRTPDRFYVHVELPGWKDTESLKVYVQRNTLHLRGDLPCSYPVAEDDLIRSERFFGPFHRKIELPPDILPEGIRARYENGLLTVELGIRTEADLPIEIPVETPASVSPASRSDEGGAEFGSDPV